MSRKGLDNELGTTSRMRSDIGTLKLYSVVGGHVFFDIVRSNGQYARLAVEPTVAADLLNRFTHRYTPNSNPILFAVGCKVEYIEDRCGRLISVKPLLN